MFPKRIPCYTAEERTPRLANARATTESNNKHANEHKRNTTPKVNLNEKEEARAASEVDRGSKGTYAFVRRLLIWFGLP